MRYYSVSLTLTWPSAVTHQRMWLLASQCLATPAIHDHNYLPKNCIWYTQCEPFYSFKTLALLFNEIFIKTNVDTLIKTRVSWHVLDKKIR